MRDFDKVCDKVSRYKAAAINARRRSSAAALILRVTKGPWAGTFKP